MTKPINKKKQAKLNSLFQQAVAAQKLKNWQQAEQAYKQLLQIDSSYVPAYINLGAVYRQLQQFDKAKKSYKQALEYAPESLEARFNLGNLLLSAQEWPAAYKAFSQVLEVCRKMGNAGKIHQFRALAQLATLARKQGKWQEAINNLQLLLKFKPDHADTYLELGNAYRHLGLNQKALEHYQYAVEYSPRSWKMHYSLARLADQLAKEELFNKHYQLAVQLSDSPFYVHLALAQTRFDNGNINGTIEQYQLALRLQNDSYTAKLGLASALMVAGKVGQAQELYQQLGQSNDVHELSQLAREIWTHKFFPESIAILKRMVELRPDLYDTHLNLAKAYSQTWEFSKALPCIDKSLEIKPDCVEAKDLLADIYVRQGSSDESAEIYEEKLKRDDSKAANAASLLFTLLYSYNRSVEYKAQRHKELMQQLLPGKAYHFSPRDYNKKQLKIGYISGDYRDQHPVGLFITPVLQNHDRQQFSIFAYYNNRTYDQSTEQIKDLTDRWYEVSSWTDERLQQQIIADEIDILVDLSGQTGKNRLGVFALRAAPVQISWLGYPHSTGLSNMDYLIADPITCPPENDYLCSEKVYRLAEHCVFCYPTFDQYPAYNFTQKKSENIVFGSFNNLTKVNAYTLKLWIKLLKSVPNASLYLKTPSFTDAECIKQFYNDFEVEGINRERLFFTGPSGLDDMMLEYLQIDIGLDPIPYNGGTTTMQALWMGVPVITLAGDNFCGRMGAGIMHYAGLSDWIADTEEDYIRIAQEKATNPSMLGQFKSSLREQIRQSPLFDNKGFTLALEHAYQSIWQEGD